MSRKPAKARRRSARPTAPAQSDQATLPLQPSAEATLSLLPMEIQVGDRFTAEGFEWEVVAHPASLHGGKSLRARVQRPELPESEREITWPAYGRIDVRRRR